MNLEAQISHKFRGKNPQQYTNKLNLPIYIKNYTSETSEVYFRNAMLFETFFF